MDSVSRETRSRIMAAIHGSNTGPELLVRRALFARGFRYRINCKGLPGHPDLKLTKHRAVVFVHGCFWHGHDCRFYRLPSSNVEFWAAKIARNRERDARNLRDLREAGWRACIVWECAARLAAAGKDRGRLFDGMGSLLAGKKPFIE
jgi:DNA mismatch endonuclease, patch repair protein